MAIAAFIVSVFALFISAATFYHSHLHVSQKFFAYLNIDNFLNDNKVPITVLNAGNKDIVLLSWYMGMRIPNGNGSMSRSEDVILFNPGDSPLLNPGNALSAVIKLSNKYDSHIIATCGKSPSKTNILISYFLAIKWCDSTGKEFNSVIDLFDVSLDKDNEIRGISPFKDRERNLYKLQQ